MSPMLCRMTIALVALAGATATLGAQEPPLSNATIVERSVTALAEDFRALVAAHQDAAWIGYAVPIVDGKQRMCCGNWSDGGCCGGCRLETGSDEGTSMSTRGRGAVKLEGPSRFYVLFRAGNGRVEKIRAYSEDCSLDAGGRTVHWLSGVTPEDSIRLLQGFVSTSGASRDELWDAAIMAIAMHGDPAADVALDTLSGAGQPVRARKKVAFWLGNARGEHGLQSLQRMLRDDADDEVRKAAVFGVSQSSQPDAFETLATTARTDRSEKIRGEALFWMAQKGDKRAGPVILEALEKDASRAVRKKAVFALSQLRDDTGVPHLIMAARTHDSQDVRGEALFWLSQKASGKAASAITDAIANDPETEVKKRAVFALSQLPKDEGVPRLIEVARTNGNREVRKQAIFWLGQSKDPRALAYFEEVLK
jgi:HEAT repeat protein